MLPGRRNFADDHGNENFDCKDRTSVLMDYSIFGRRNRIFQFKSRISVSITEMLGKEYKLKSMTEFNFCYLNGARFGSHDM